VYTKVSELISPITGFWDEELLYTLFIVWMHKESWKLPLITKGLMILYLGITLEMGGTQLNQVTTCNGATSLDLQQG
jgi:hypothetical protein